MKTPTTTKSNSCLSKTHPFSTFPPLPSLCQLGLSFLRRLKRWQSSGRRSSLSIMRASSGGAGSLARAIQRPSGASGTVSMMPPRHIHSVRSQFELLRSTRKGFQGWGDSCLRFFFFILLILIRWRLFWDTTWCWLVAHAQWSVRPWPSEPAAPTGKGKGVRPPHQPHRLQEPGPCPRSCFGPLKDACVPVEQRNHLVGHRAANNAGSHNKFK